MDSLQLFEPATIVKALTLLGVRRRVASNVLAGIAYSESTLISDVICRLRSRHGAATARMRNAGNDQLGD
jgi:hypothetical protein